MNAAPLARILIVDDEAAQMRALCDTLTDQGYETAGFTAGEDALGALREGEFDLLLTDLMMPGMDGVALLAEALKIDPHLVGIVMTGQGTIETAVQAMQAGALDYILKPFRLSEIRPVLSRALSLRRLRLENLELRNTVAIHELNEAIAHTLDLNVLLDKIADAALAQLEGDEASLMLLSDDGSFLYVAAVRGEKRDTLLGTRLPVGEGIAGWVAARREPLVLEGAVKDPHLVPPYPRAAIQSALSLPIVTHGKLFGVLNVNCTRRPRSFSLGQIKGLSMFTTAAAAGIEAAQLYEEQRRSNTRYIGVVEQLERAQRLAHIGTDIRDLRTGAREWSDETYRIFGASRDSFVATYDNVLALIHLDDHHLVYAMRAQVAAGIRPDPIEFRIVRPDGSIRHVHRESELIRDEAGEPVQLLGTILDITEREQAAQKIQAQMERAEALLEAAPEPVVIVDRAGRIAMVNARTEIVFGFPRAELLGQPVEMLIPERLRAEHVAQRAAYQQNPSAREMGAGRDLFARHKDGSEFAVDVSLSPLATPDGTLIISTVRDVSERKKAERRIAAQLEHLTLLDHITRVAQHLAHLGTNVRDLRTGAREWSDETYRIFGVARESFDATYENLLALVHPDDRHLILAARAKMAAGIAPDSIEYRIIRPGGSVRYIYREWEIIRNADGEPIQSLGTIQDITERHRTEEQLRQAQKMEAIGNLTGGMAHDFNNLLGVIIGNLDLARERAGSDEELQELVGEALEAAWRGADLTRRLLAFARRQPLRPARIDVNELVSDTTRLLRRLLGEDVEISLSLAEHLWPVTADPAQLEASLANLATNARDAMPKGGRLIITTANRHLDADYAASHADVTPGDFAMIEVSDTGIGMSAEIMSQIFEPFFTTKEEGRGTGLGLSMVFGFMKQSGGHINVYSEPGSGTTFRLYLPRTEAEAAQHEASRTPPAARGAGETVLVVEDNLAVRRIVVRQLRELGYRVLESDRAATALEVLRGEPVDLLFTDIVMSGGLDGVELAHLARERWPTLKIVLTSGFPQARLDGNGALFDSLQLLSKPYRKEELAAALRTALDG